MSTFKVGEVAILVCDPDCTGDSITGFYDGQDVLIVGPVDEYPIEGQSFMVGYDCKTADGENVIALPHELRKKRPPGTDEAERLTAELFDRLTQRVPA